MTLLWDKAVEELSAAIPVRHRWAHVWGVLETAMALTDRHGLDPETTAWAALLHDCAKCLDRSQLEALMHEQSLAEEEDDWCNPQVWHALVGAHLARNQYGIQDDRILRAIRYHPTGAPDMDGLAMTLFVADYTEPTRNYEGSREFRRKALELPLVEIAAAICRNKIEHVRRKGRTVHRRSLRALDSLEARLREDVRTSGP